MMPLLTNVFVIVISNRNCSPGGIIIDDWIAAGTVGRGGVTAGPVENCASLASESASEYTYWHAGPLYRAVTSRSGRNAISVVVGFGLMHFMIGQWAFFILASIVLPYLSFQATSRPFLVSALCSFLLLLVVHTYRFV